MNYLGFFLVAVLLAVAFAVRSQQTAAAAGLVCDKADRGVRALYPGQTISFTVPASHQHPMLLFAEVVSCYTR